MKILTPILLLCLCLPVQALDIDPYVSNIVTAGEWAQQEETGFYRFITKTYGSEHVFSRLYIQWISYHIDGGSDSRVVAEVAVKELNEKYLSFKSPVCAGDFPCVTFKILTVDAFNYDKRIFNLQMPSIGRYVFSKQISIVDSLE